MPAKKRKTLTPTAETPTAHTTELPATPGSEPDVFDQAIAARHATHDVTVSTADTATEPTPAGGSPAATGPTALQPDPFPALSVALADRADAPRVRLFRNRRMNQVAVRFDEKPAEAVRQRMRDEGYKWREAERVWTKQLGEHKATGQLAAEQLVEDIANAIRYEGGLAPVGRAVGV